MRVKIGGSLMKQFFAALIVGILIFVGATVYTLTVQAQVDNSHLPYDASVNVKPTIYLYYKDTSNYVYQTCTATAVLWTRCSNSVINIKTNSLY